MTENDKRRYIAYLSLKGELDNVKDHGAGLYIDGIAADPARIAGICIFNEGSDYMRDYVTDGSGNLNRLSFDKVYNA